ncbi:MAG: hypothetical protein JXD19_09600 [Deltaproteobacteria bacterium]|nr:hypothetical protein [Deltaproteobacteria bacterium]
MNLHTALKEKFSEVVKKNGWESEEIQVRAKTLTPEEAIGNPEEKDYPIITGRERIVEADFRGAKGHAFTDMFGNFNGTINEVLSMELKNNFRRAIFIATINAVLRHAGLINGNIHCKDQTPRECSHILVEKIKSDYGNPKIALVGFQPRMAEALAQNFQLRITDLDKKNIGTEKYGVVIQDPSCTQENIDWGDLLVVTGSTAVNDTMKEFIGSKPVLFYGVTVAGPAFLLGVPNFCPLGT